MLETDEIQDQTTPQSTLDTLPEDPLADHDSPGDPLPDPFFAKDSTLKASKEEHAAAARGGRVGRPHVNEDGMSTSVLKQDSPLPFPLPRFRTFKNDATVMNQRSKSFYTYWNQLPTWAKEQCVLYVYRDWPVFKTLAEDSGEVQYIDKILGCEPLSDDVDLLNRFGAGSYRLLLNEYQSKTSKKFKPGDDRHANTVCTVYVIGLGMQDLKSHPPVDRRISDVENVDLDQPANKSYVEYLRGRGLLPEQSAKVNKEAEVATLQLVDKLTQQNTDLMNRAINVAESKGKEQQPLAEALLHGAKQANEMMKEASVQANQVLISAMNQAATIRDNARGEGGSSSTGDSSIQLALELADRIAGANKAPGPDPTMVNEIQELRRRLDASTEARFSMLEKLLAERGASQAVAPSPFSSVKEGLTAMRAMKEMVEEMSGGKEANPVAEAAAAAGAPAWLMPAITIGLPIVGNIVQAIMSRQQGAPQPFQPVNMPGPGPMQPMPSQSPSNVTVMPAPQAIAAAPQPATGQAGQDPAAPPPKPPLETYGLPMEVALLLHEVKTPLVQYMNGRISGDDFADWFVGGYGDALWKQIADSGAESLAGAILAFPPIMEKLTALNIGPERVKVFAEEFVKWTPEEPEGIQGA